MGLTPGRLLVVLGSGIILVLLHVVYVDHVSPLFGSQVYRYAEPSLYSLLTHGLIAVLPAIWMPLRIVRPSEIAYWIHYYGLYIPVVQIPLYLGLAPPSRLLLIALLFLILFGGIRLTQLLPRLELPRIRVGRVLFGGALVAISLLVLIYSAVATGATGLRLSVVTSYDVRDQFEAIVSQHGARIVYLTTWAGNAIHPALMAIGLARGRLLLFLAGAGGQILLFSMLGMKSFLFSVFLLLILYALLRREGRGFGVRFVTGICLAIPLCLYVDGFFEIPWATGLALRRIMIVPGLLTGYYLDFFSQNPRIFLSDNFLSSFFEYPYPMDVPRMIGMTYLNDLEKSANVNYWASAFAQFGLAGMVLFTGLYSFYAWIFDSLARGRSIRVTGLLFAVPAITLTNSSLQTSLLTHGLGVLLVLLYFLPARETSGESP